MSYNISYSSAFAKDIKGYKKSPQIKAAILGAIDEILKSPEGGELLKGQWDGFMKYSFHKSPEFRIIYHLYDCCRNCDMQKCDLHETPKTCIGHINFVFAKTREECNNLYRKDKKYISNFDLGSK